MAGNRFQLEFERPISKLEEQIRELEERQRAKGIDCSAEIRELRDNVVRLQKKTFSSLTAWETVQLARHPQRPHAVDYIDLIVKEFAELHGDRKFGDDKAIITGLGRIGGERVMVIANRKGKDVKERMGCNFGCANPEGYRKAMLKMRMAAKFHVPVVSLIDTPGAYPGVGAEERGIAEAIAFNLLEMSRLPTPVVCVVIGEGGSGGALGIGVGDRVAVLEHAYYSVISPEGCAAILWKGGEHAGTAAEALRLTSRSLKELGIVDDIVPEPLGGAHRDPAAAGAAVERWIVRNLRELRGVKTDKLLEMRYAKFRSMGRFAEPASLAATAAVS